MYPQLEVRPLVSGRVEARRMGISGFRPAAQITFGDTRQSKRAFQRELDKAKRRYEDWMIKCSAEPYLLGSFPSFSSLATKSFNLVGTLPQGQEVRELQVVFEGTLKINAATGQIQAPDYNVLGFALIKKLRASLYGNNDAYNLNWSEARTIAWVADNRDCNQSDPNLRIGVGLTTTAFTCKLRIKIPFCVRSIEVPEVFSPCSDQINLPGSKVDLDTQGDALTTVALTSGAGTFVVSDVKLYAILNQVPTLHAGPPHIWKTKNIAQSIDTEYGQGCDIFVGTEEAATVTGAGARVSNFQVRRDGRSQPMNIDPVTLAQQFLESQFTADALAALDITTGLMPGAGVATAAQPVPSASIGTQAGSAVTPLLWNDGRIRAGAWQWPTWLQQRVIQQNLVAGQSASIVVLYWQVRPVYEGAQQLVALAAANRLAIRDIDQLAVRGGNDGEVYKQFKGRFMKLATPPQGRSVGLAPSA